MLLWLRLMLRLLLIKLARSTHGLRIGLAHIAEWIGLADQTGKLGQGIGSMGIAALIVIRGG